jgi:ABC-type nickel/cobalt efflux system permease component RcnA
MVFRKYLVANLSFLTNYNAWTGAGLGEYDEESGYVEENSVDSGVTQATTHTHIHTHTHTYTQTHTHTHTHTHTLTHTHTYIHTQVVATVDYNRSLAIDATAAVSVMVA